jgi:hypothetical protein
MNLVDEYLRAVSLLLPKAQADDIIAELRDTILSRIEAREAELGRPLTDDETEAVLREIGHPVVVAARYREGPQHVVGPTLYPYWLFAVKLGLAIQVVAAVLVLVIQTFAGGDFGLALGRAISSVVEGGLTIVGLATVGAWLIERQRFRIDYLDNWHVRDLWFLDWIAWDWETLRDWFNGHGGPRGPGGGPPRSRPSADRPRPERRSERPAERPSDSRSDARAYDLPPPPRWSPAGHGASLVLFGAVFALWWVWLRQFDPAYALASLTGDGFDPGPLAAVNWDGLRAGLFWPVFGYGAFLVLRGVVLIAWPWAVRAQGMLEAASGAAVAGFAAWLWTASPLSSAIRVDGIGAFADRWAASPSHTLPLAPVATAIVAIVFLAGIGALLRGLWDMLAGPPPVDHWALGA